MVVAYQFFDTVAPGDFVKCDFLLYHFIRGKNKGFQYIDFLFDLFDQFLYLFGTGDDDYGKFVNARDRRFRSRQAFDIDIPASEYRRDLAQ